MEKRVKPSTQSLLLELDRLKLVYRNAFLADQSRHENSAEHSWHVATALLALGAELRMNFNLEHAVKIALVHDVCEIGAGDLSIYDSRRAEKTKDEEAYLSDLALRHPVFGQEVSALWQEYEKQETPESRAVKVVDRLLPFLLNLATQGATWRKLSITRTQVLNINRTIETETPHLFSWMEEEIEAAVESGWLDPQ